MQVSQAPFVPGIQGDQPWAMVELGRAWLGDPRRTARLIELASSLVEKPSCSLPEACGNWAATKAAYRFFSNEEIEPGDILAAHRQSTVERVREHSMVLAIQDTTVYNFTTHRSTRGQGPISGKQKGYTKGPTGFFVHSCLAVAPEDGTPLGLLGQDLWVRPETDGSAGSDPDEKRSAQAKESLRWQAMLRAGTEGLPPTTRVLTVTDREGDLFDFFVAATQEHKDILVRAKWDRRLGNQDTHLWQAVEQAPVVGHHTVEVTRAENRPGRTAQLELRVAKVTLQVPSHLRSGGLSPVALSAVLARELDPPDGQEPTEWLLLTTLDISAEAGAMACVQWYSYRWKIERYHYTLKSGCRIEELQLEDVDRLHRALAVYSVVAWRLLYLTYLARRGPEQPCTLFLSDSEWKALYCSIHRTNRVPAKPPDLQTAVIWIARLGGFLARKHDGAPGVKVLWRGFRNLQERAVMWDLLRPNH